MPAGVIHDNVAGPGDLAGGRATTERGRPGRANSEHSRAPPFGSWPPYNATAPRMSSGSSGSGHSPTHGRLIDVQPNPRLGSITAQPRN